MKKGSRHSAETLAKISKSLRGRKPGFAGKTHTAEARTKLHVANIGKCLSVETRSKLSLAKLGNKNSVGRIAWNKGKKLLPLSAETRDKIRNSRIAHMESFPLDCQCVVHKTWRSRGRTNLELALEKVLSEFPEIQIQKTFGRFRIDAYLPPPYHLAFEADGTYWHERNRDFDICRDKELLDRFSLPVIRLSEEDLSPY